MGEKGVLEVQEESNRIVLTIPIEPGEGKRAAAMIRSLEAGRPLLLRAGGDPNCETSLSVRKVRVVKMGP